MCANNSSDVAKYLSYTKIRHGLLLMAANIKVIHFEFFFKEGGGKFFGVSFAYFFAFYVPKKNIFQFVKISFYY